MKYKFSHFNVHFTYANEDYIWNTFSGGLIRLNQSGRDYIAIFEGNEDDSSEFLMLKNNGFIVIDQFNEIGRLIHDEKSALYAKSASNLSIVIAPGMGCNYRCTYCFQEGISKNQAMAECTAEDIADYICRIIQNNIHSIKKVDIKWFGGEPLLYIDQIEAITGRILVFLADKEVEYTAGIITNGRYLTKEILAKLLELKVRMAQITIDGMCETYCISKRAIKDDFNAVIDNINNAANQISLTIRLNIPDNDADEAIRITDYLLIEKGLLDKVQLYMANVTDYTLSVQDRRNKYRDFIRNYTLWLDHLIALPGFSGEGEFAPMRHVTSCGLIRANNRCIGPSGELYKCEHLFGDIEKTIGNIYDGDFYNETSRLYSRATDERSSKCLECSFLPVCMGGCAHDSVSSEDCIPCDEYRALLIKRKIISGIGIETYRETCQI